ncbi:MAG: hypothetical protein ACK5PG_05925 [Lysobacterales bacterium]|jgi:hypothetical protein
MQQTLALPDSEAAKAWRIAAEHALRDPFRGPREREERRAYYLRRAEEIERGENL